MSELASLASAKRVRHEGFPFHLRAHLGPHVFPGHHFHRSL